MKRARKPALRRTLVLTQGYVPHKVVTWQTALTNYYKGSVEIVASYHVARAAKASGPT